MNESVFLKIQGIIRMLTKKPLRAFAFPTFSRNSAVLSVIIIVAVTQSFAMRPQSYAKKRISNFFIDFLLFGQPLRVYQ